MGIYVPIIRFDQNNIVQSDPQQHPSSLDGKVALKCEITTWWVIFSLLLFIERKVTKQKSCFCAQNLQFQCVSFVAMQKFHSVTCSLVYMTSWGWLRRPEFFTSGRYLCRAHATAYRLLMAPPGENIPSPSSHPMNSLILVRTISSIRVNTGAISYVNLRWSVTYVT